MILNILLLLTLTCFYIIYRIIAGRKEEKYFADRGITCHKSPSYLWKLKDLLTENVAETMDKLYKNHENERVFGVMDAGLPFYIIRDAALAKQITIKGFDHFMDHLKFVDGDLDPLFGNSLVSLQGKRWKSMRVALTPAFTGSKMRQMFQLVQQCSSEMADYFKDQSSILGPQIYNMKEIYTKYTNDVIASCAFGVKCDSFRNPNNEFFKIGQKILKFTSPWNMIKIFFYSLYPSKALAKWLDIKIINGHAQNVFKDIILTNIRNREEKDIIRPDMINLLMQLKKGQLKSTAETDTNKGIAAAEDHTPLTSTDTNMLWTDDELVPQCFIFFFAGFDTSSTVMTFVAYELAVNQEIQQRLLDEIDHTKAALDGKPLDYEHLQAMRYLDMVIAETLRKWPPASVIDRSCNKEFIYREDDGFEMKIAEGSAVLIPSYSLHRDPKYFPDPERFFPDRFNDENKFSQNMDAYMPFGIGPRNCIGSRFALMEVKSVIYHLLLNFTFEVCKKTQIPVKLQKTMFGVREEKVELMLKPRIKS